MGIIRKIAVILLVIVITVTAYGVLNTYAVSQLQFRGYAVTDFDLFSELGANIQFQACNPTFFPATYEKFRIDMAYDAKQIGIFKIDSATVWPKSTSIIDARVDLNAEALAGLMLASLGAALSGQETEIDVNKLNFDTLLDAPILDVIPFWIENQYSYSEFQGLLSGSTGFEC